MSVYFAQPAASSVEPIKIGFTENWDRRVVELERQHQREMRLLALSNGGRRLERALHEIFSPYNVAGEWFEPCDDILRLIEDIRVNGPKALPALTEEPAPVESVRVELVREEAERIVRLLGGTTGSAKEQVAQAAAKTGLSHTQIERLRYRKVERIYADIMDCLRTVMANEVDAVTSSDLFAIKRHIARLKLTTPAFGPRLGFGRGEDRDGSDLLGGA